MEKVQKKKRHTLTQDQINNINHQMHFMSVLIMRLHFRLWIENVNIPEEELHMVESFLDWYCDQFNYKIHEGKFVPKND